MILFGYEKLLERAMIDGDMLRWRVYWIGKNQQKIPLAYCTNAENAADIVGRMAATLYGAGIDPKSEPQEENDSSR